MTSPAGRGYGRQSSDSHSESHQSSSRSSSTKFTVELATGMLVDGSGVSVQQPPSTRKRKLDSPSPEISSTPQQQDEDSSGGDGTSCTSLQLTPSKVSRHESMTAFSLTQTQHIAQHADSPSTSAQGSSGSLLFHYGLGDQQPHLVPDPVSHRYVVHISDTGLLARARSATDLGADGRVIPPYSPSSESGGAGSSRSGANRRSSHQYRFDCDLGDIWTDVELCSASVGLVAARRAQRKMSTAATTSSDNVVECLEQRGYTVLSQLAKGRYTTVYEAQSATERRRVAVKLLPSSDVKCVLKRDHDQWTAEIPNDEVRIHESLKHENIVAVLAHHQIDRRIAVILELCENGSMTRLLARTPGGMLTEPVSRRYFLQMHAALTYLHSHGIVHRDVTCDNFLLDARDSLKLSDFGCAMYYKTGDPQFTSRQGSAGYWPPEVLEHKPFNPRHVDVWCLGVCLHILLTSRLPFTGDSSSCSSSALDEDECLTRMQKGVELAPTGVRSVRLSAPALELLRGLLHYVTEVRYSLNRIACSDWINGRPGPMLRSATCAQLQQQTSTASGKPFIGNFYLVAKPQKYRDSLQEKALKDTYGI